MPIHSNIETDTVKTEYIIKEQMQEENRVMPDPHKIFVVHGRNEKTRKDFFSFLRALDLKPIEWSEALHLTGKASPYIGEILDTAFNNSQAIVVLLTPDDEVRLRRELWSSLENEEEKLFLMQARPNVLFEAGMAFGRYPDRTLLVEIGRLKQFSDVAGRHVVRLTNEPGNRKEIANRLKTAGCSVSTDGSDWLNIGDFEDKSLVVEPKSGEPNDGEVQSVKYVDQNYPKDSGLQDELLKKGYTIRWCSEENLSRRLDFEGWALVKQSTSIGKHIIFRIKDKPYDLTLIMKPIDDDKKD